MKSTNSTRVKAPYLFSGSGCRGNDVAMVVVVPDDPASTTQKPYSSEKQTKNNQKNGKNISSIVSCRSVAQVGTFNIRTAREQHKRIELAEVFLQSKMRILALQEHRVVHDEPIKIERLNKGVHLVTSSAWRNGAGASTGGVGLILTKIAYEAISLIKPYSSRILTMSFNGNPRLTVISCYSPTEAASDEEAENFHDTLRQAISDVPAHHFLMVLGDMNARLGRIGHEDKGWYFHERTNRNGELLRETAQAGGLELTNHCFRKRRGKLWTHLSDGTLTKGQIDYILVRKKWRNSVKNTEVYNFFNSLGSDHRAVVCTIKLSLRKSPRCQSKIHYDFNKLKKDTELQEKYAVEVKNRFSCLTSEEQEDATEGATGLYSKLVESIEAANEKLLPRKPRRKPDDPANDERVQAAREKLFLAKDRYHQSPNEENREIVAETKSHLSECYKVVEEETLTRKIRGVEGAADRCKNKESWDLVNDITGRTRTNAGLIEGGSSEDRLKNWKDHFLKLLGQPPSVPDENLLIATIHPELDIRTDPFDLEELHEAKKQIVEGKACGDDGIPPEVLKRVDIDEIILEFCNEALCEGQVPTQWKTCNIVPVPKKGDLTKTDNYRGIALTSIVSKTLNRMILNRIRPSVEELLRDNQNGFRQGRSTTTHILALRRILEGAQAKNLTAVMLFIDFKKAFDSVHRGLLMKILRAYGIPEIIVSFIQVMYTGTLAKVMTPDGLTEVFEILAGVLQGDTLAPYLFIIVVDYIMRTTLGDVETDAGFTIQPARSRRVQAKKIADTEFADDLAIITNTIEEAQQLLLSIESAAASVGLNINESKTQYLTANREEDGSTITSRSGQVLEKVEDFVYLGAWIATTEHDFRVRKAKAWAACHKMKAIWKSNMRRNLKIRLFQATVESILLYGTETWTVTESLKKKIDGCYSRMLRMALNVDWREHRSNKEVFGTLPRVSSKIQARRMRLAGHIQRHDDLVAHDLLLWEPSHGYRGRGRPPLTFVDTLRKDTGLVNTEEIRRLMADRKLWRDKIETRTLKPP